MPLSLEFAASCHYASEDGIEIPTEISVGSQKVELIARLDTGAAHCIFERRYGEELGLDVESGRVQRFRTMAGSFVAHEHEVTIHTLGVEFPAAVFFAQDSGFTRNFLGRSGWLNRLRIGIIDHDLLLFLSAYES